MKEFISKAKKLHRNYYDYSKVKYLNSRSEVIIICPEHENKIGNPLILPKLYFRLLMSLKKEEGAKKYLPPEEFYFVKTSVGTIFDIDFVGDLKKAETLINI